MDIEHDLIVQINCGLPYYLSSKEQKLELLVINQGISPLKDLQLRVSSDIFKGHFKSKYVRHNIIHSGDSFTPAIKFFIRDDIEEGKHSLKIELIYADEDCHYRMVSGEAFMVFQSREQHGKPEKSQIFNVYAKIADIGGVSTNFSNDNVPDNKRPDHEGKDDFRAVDIYKNHFDDSLIPCPVAITLDVHKHFKRDLEETLEFIITRYGDNIRDIDIRPQFMPAECVKKITKTLNHVILDINCGNRAQIKLSDLELQVTTTESDLTYKLKDGSRSMLSFHTDGKEGVELFEDLPLSMVRGFPPPPPPPPVPPRTGCNSLVFKAGDKKLFIFTGDRLVFGRKEKIGSNKVLVRALPCLGNCDVLEYDKTSNSGLLCANCLLSMGISRDHAELLCEKDSLLIRMPDGAPEQKLCNRITVLSELRVKDSGELRLKPGYCREVRDECAEKCAGFLLKFKVFKNLHVPDLDGIDPASARTNLDSVLIERPENCPTMRYVLLPRAIFLNTALDVLERAGHFSLVNIDNYIYICPFSLSLIINGKRVMPGQKHMLKFSDDIRTDDGKAISVHPVTKREFVTG